MKQTNVLIKLVIFTIINNSLAIFLKDNKLPSQEINPDFPLEKAVKNLFESKTNIILKEKYAEQLYTISLEKDICIIYFILIPEAEIKSRKTQWKQYSEIDIKVPDYQIISYAVQRLRWKIEYTNVVYSLLSDEFTLSNLQKIYEAILNKNLDKRNFRKKIMSLNFLTQTGKKRIGSARPAQMYKFREKTPEIVNVFS